MSAPSHAVESLPSPLREELARFVEEQRALCLWYMREDFLPVDFETARLALDAIEKHGDRAAFLRAAELRRWLSTLSNATPAAS